MFKHALAAALSLSIAHSVLAESGPSGDGSKYKWHNALMTDGQLAVVKQDSWITDNLEPGHNPVEAKTARMVIERVTLNGRRALRLFEIHGWPICAQAVEACPIHIMDKYYKRGFNSSSSAVNGKLYRGAAKKGPDNSAFITNDAMVELLWDNDSFSINTFQWADYNSGNPAEFLERAGEHQTKLAADSDLPFEDLNNNAWNGVTRRTTEGSWDFAKRSSAIVDSRKQEEKVAKPRTFSF